MEHSVILRLPALHDIVDDIFETDAAHVVFHFVDGVWAEELLNKHVIRYWFFLKSFLPKEASLSYQFIYDFLGRVSICEELLHLNYFFNGIVICLQKHCIVDGTKSEIA